MRPGEEWQARYVKVMRGAVRCVLVRQVWWVQVRSVCFRNGLFGFGRYGKFR